MHPAKAIGWNEMPFGRDTLRILLLPEQQYETNNMKVIKACWSYYYRKMCIYFSRLQITVGSNGHFTVVETVLPLSSFPFYYVSAQHNVAGGVLFLSCVHPCVHPETLLTWYLAEYLTHFHQTYISNALWDRDERFTIWGQKVKGQGHGGIKYAENSTFWACQHDILRSISRIFTKLTLMMYYGTEMNALHFGIKRSKFRVTAE